MSTNKLKASIIMGMEASNVARVLVSLSAVAALASQASAKPPAPKYNLIEISDPGSVGKAEGLSIVNVSREGRYMLAQNTYNHSFLLYGPDFTQPPKKLNSIGGFSKATFSCVNDHGFLVGTGDSSEPSQFFLLEIGTGSVQYFTGATGTGYVGTWFPTSINARNNIEGTELGRTASSYYRATRWSADHNKIVFPDTAGVHINGISVDMTDDDYQIGYAQDPSGAVHDYAWIYHEGSPTLVSSATGGIDPAAISDTHAMVGTLYNGTFSRVLIYCKSVLSYLSPEVPGDPAVGLGIDAKNEVLGYENDQSDGKFWDRYGNAYGINNEIFNLTKGVTPVWVALSQNGVLFGQYLNPSTQMEEACVAVPK
jgi:hypothetical protein